MKYRGVKLFMKKLEQIIYDNDNRHVRINLIQSKIRHPLQSLYEELGSMIQTLFVEKANDLHNLEEGRNLMGRLEDVVEEARDMLDLFVLHNSWYFKKQLRYNMSDIIIFPRELTEDVMRSIKSIKEDYFSILKMESSSRTKSLKTQSAVAGGVTSSSSRNALPLGSSISVWDEIVVGLDGDVDLIRGKLSEDTRKLDIVSIVGMGGLGKTTLATKVFNDGFVRYHFHIRGWVTVSQTYEKTHLLNRILASIGVEIDPNKKDNYSHLRGKLHECLMDQRYLFVIDDIWNTGAWDDLKIFFPDHNNGSRLLLTSRHKIVALHAKPLGFVHELGYLTEEQSWELLHKKVFRGQDFPESLTSSGKQIARNCRGLPLALVVIAGVLAREPLSKDSWERISRSGSGSSSVVMETLALSLNHLPSHLRNCFLYLGGFPEDYRFGVTRLIWLWIAEGFIQEAENQSLEETAKDYLMELVDRNLVVVQDRKFDCGIKTFSVHDVLRELSCEIATKERFSRQVLGWENRMIAPHKTSRLVIFPNCTIWRCGIYSRECSVRSYIAMKCSRSWRLLTVLDLKQVHPNYFPANISLLVNLRYLAICNEFRDFQSKICDLKSLQTLIIEGLSFDTLVLPNTISNLVNLRHLQCRWEIIFTPLETPLMNLQTISNVVLGDEPTSWVNYFPGVKKLSCSIYRYGEYDFKSLIFLEILKICCVKSQSIPRFKNRSIIRFPASLKKLTLNKCRLPWSFMSTIQSLPNLEVLKLLTDAFVGPQWDAGEVPFQQLKFLKLLRLDIQQWEASSINFPCLKRLVLYRCFSLERIPLDMMYIPTLEDIQIEGCSDSVFKSAYEIQQEQRADGNYDLKIRDESTLFTSLEEVFIHGTNIVVRTRISINLLTPEELQALGLPAYRYRRWRRVWKWYNGRSNNRPIKPNNSKNPPIRWKNFKEVRY